MHIKGKIAGCILSVALPLKNNRCSLLPFPFFRMITDHVVIFRHVSYGRIIEQLLSFQNLLDSSIGKQRTSVTDTGNLFQMRTDIKKRKPFFHITTDNSMELFQLIITDKGSNFVQHDQMISHNHSPEQFYNDPFKSGKLLHIFIKWNVHSDIFKKGLHLPVQDLCADHPLAKARTQDKNIICNVQISCQRTFLLDNADPVCCLVILFPGVYLFPSIIYITVIEGKIPLQKFQKSCFPMTVNRQKSHNLPLKDLKVEVLQLYNLILFIRHTLHSENFVSHTNTLLFFTCLSSVSIGMVISTSVPSPGTE